MYYVYAIKSVVRKYIYVGITNNLKRRFEEHNSGSNKTTKAYRPFVLIYYEECKDRIEARTKEKYFKSGGWERIFEGFTKIIARVAELVAALDSKSSGSNTVSVRFRTRALKLHPPVVDEVFLF